jgi:hypothetical protein
MATSCAGYSLLELVFAVSLGTTLTAMAMPAASSALDEYRTAGAVRYVSARLARARMEAIVRSADVGVRFTASADGYQYAAYVDGNANGIRTRDIQRGVDGLWLAQESLASQFPGVEFGVAPGLPAVDANAGPPGTDPIHLGSANILTFTAAGTATSGSLYIRGKGSSQWVIRIFGETGRTRLLKFDPRTRRWSPP